MPSYSSPTHVVWEYFRSLRLLVQGTREARSPEEARQQAALAVIMAVTVVEVFFNLWFRTRVDELDKSHQTSLQRDLNARKSIDFKLKNWPTRYLAAELDLTKGPGAEFAEIKSLRNSIVHFTSSHESVEVGGLAFHGVADITAYDDLGERHASAALTAAEALVSEVFRLAGLAAQDVSRLMHAWTGSAPVGYLGSE